MWRVPGRTHLATPTVEPHGPGRVPTPAAHAAPRPRPAIEEDLRRLCALQADMRSGHIPAERTFAAIIAGRTDRLLDELLLLPGGRVLSVRRCPGSTSPTGLLVSRVVPPTQTDAGARADTTGRLRIWT
jgi:hypothetical protein